jgi:hypothetical protein
MSNHSSRFVQLERQHPRTFVVLDGPTMIVHGLEQLRIHDRLLLRRQRLHSQQQPPAADLAFYMVSLRPGRYPHSDRHGRNPAPALDLTAGSDLTKGNWQTNIGAMVVGKETASAVAESLIQRRIKEFADRL